MIELTTTETKPLWDSNVSDLNWGVKFVRVKIDPDCIWGMVQYSEYTRILLNDARVDVQETIEEIEALINKTRISVGS